jgi:hypothetical protein
MRLKLEDLSSNIALKGVTVSAKYQTEMMHSSNFYFVSIVVTVWNGIIWILIGTRGGPLWKRERSLWFYKNDVIWPAEGPAMAHAGSCRSHAMQTRVYSQVCRSGICGRKSGTGRYFSPSTSIFTRQYHCKISLQQTPYYFSKLGHC